MVDAASTAIIVVPTRYQNIKGKKIKIKEREGDPLQQW
jgi:hypothetical protein